jgi:methyl-accepting chemotaxis protein
MLKNLTIKSRLAFVIGLLSLLLLGVGITGMISLGSVNVSLKSVYDDRLVALGDLDRVVRLILRNQLSVAKAVGLDPAGAGKHMDEVDKNMEELSRLWARYMSTSLTPEEKKLANQFSQHLKSFLAEGLSTAAIAIRSNNVSFAKDLVQGPMEALYLPLQADVDALIQLQLNLGKKEFEASQAAYARFRNISIATIALGLMLSAFMGFWLIRAISRPLNEAIKLARSVAEGDLTQKIEVKTAYETGQLLLALKNMNDSLVKIVTEVRTGTDTIATASNEIASGNLDLSSRTEQQASSLEETASSMEELTTMVKQNADNARQANGLVVSASETAIKGGKMVSQVVDTMGSINESAKKIVDIIGVIDGIAFQTNILALNAAVEAARAGEQGRGFAVVASEVRNRAQRSAAAAKEIKILIGDSVAKVDVGAKLVDQAGVTMDEIVESVKRVTDIMAEISAASQEQTAGIEQINQAISQMNQATQQNASLVEEAAATAESLKDQAGNLAQAVGVFKLDGMRLGTARAVSTLGTATAVRHLKPGIAALGKASHPLRIADRDSAQGPAQVKKITDVPAGMGDEWEQF